MLARTVTALLTPAVLLLGLAWLSTPASAGEAKVEICHIPPGNPDNFHTWLALGWCNKRIGRLDLAIQSLEEALLVAPDQAIIHYNLACYWSLVNNSKLALRYLTQAFEIDPGFRDLVAGETDFDPIRDHPGFLELTSVIV